MPQSHGLSLKSCCPIHMRDATLPMSISRSAHATGAFTLALLLGITPVLADSLVPTVIADALTGEVLHAEDATRPWFPASTTKLMTAYVALRAVKAGQIKFETPIVVSPHASKQPPSKIGLKPGQEITLENALKILMVKSANDIAVIVAEGVGGTVPAFSGMMNREAARLGMRESHFLNPHGLHNPAQVTSARDMAILARALLTEFPDYAGLFSIGAVKLGNRVYNNTNGLIGRYSGAMGMKTGFICASGFNLVSAAERNGRTLIAVVFGAATGADRTLKAAQLLDQGFGVGGGFFGRSSNSGRSLDVLTASVETTAPNRRAEICGRRGPPASESEDAGGAIAMQEQFTDNPSRMVGLMHRPSEAAGVDAAVTAFAAPKARSATAAPHTLPGVMTAPAAASRIGTAKQAPRRPASNASLANRQPNAGQSLASSPAAPKAAPKSTADLKSKAKADLKAKATAKQKTKLTPNSKLPEKKKTVGAPL